MSSRTGMCACHGPPPAFGAVSSTRGDLLLVLVSNQPTTNELGPAEFYTVVASTFLLTHSTLALVFSNRITTLLMFHVSLDTRHAISYRSLCFVVPLQPTSCYCVWCLIRIVATPSISKCYSIIIEIEVVSQPPSSDFYR